MRWSDSQSALLCAPTDCFNGQSYLFSHNLLSRVTKSLYAEFLYLPSVSIVNQMLHQQLEATLTLLQLSSKTWLLAHHQDGYLYLKSELFLCLSPACQEIEIFVNIY